jgi:hypothetical protein
MIILYSKETTFLRVPKTGSTSLEASLRFAGCLQEGDLSSAVEDANLPEVNIPVDYVEYRNHNREIGRTISNKLTQLRSQYNDLTEEQIQLAMTEEEYDRYLWIKERRENQDFKNVGLHHATLSNLVNSDSLGWLNLLTEQQVYQFNNYAFIRNPLSRVISSFIFSGAGGTIPRTMPINIQIFHEHINENKLKSLVNRNQIDYFKYNGETHHNGNRIVIPLLFENYTNEMSNVITQLGLNPLYEYPRFKSGNTNGYGPESKPTVETWIEPYPEIKDKIIERFSEDVELWEEVSGQKI